MTKNPSEMTAEERQQFINEHGVSPEYAQRICPDDDGAFSVITDPDEIKRLDEAFRLQEAEDDE